MAGTAGTAAGTSEEKETTEGEQSTDDHPTLPPEIQYWAGVIMRNACRKDETRGGIRQCANMLCGRWESYPREFAKCRRCRKAKYCGKECQSTAWSEGHRFWCSAKDAEEEGGDGSSSHRSEAGSSSSIPISQNGTRTALTVPTGSRRERDRTTRERTRSNRTETESSSRSSRAAAAPGAPSSSSSTSTIIAPRAEAGMSRDRTVQPSHPHSSRSSRPSRTITVTQVNPDPATTSFVSFSGHAQHPQMHMPPFGHPLEAGSILARRRAETITPSSMAEGSSMSSPHRRTGVSGMPTRPTFSSYRSMEESSISDDSSDMVLG